jgi:hypothetical protein
VLPDLRTRRSVVLTRCAVFKVRAAGKRFILRYDQADDEWTLQSAYDGAELFSRSNVRMITIDSTMVRAAEKLIESCEHCNPEGAAIPFDNVLDRVTGSDPAFTDYILQQPANCPHCRREILEKTLALNPRSLLDRQRHGCAIV